MSERPASTCLFKYVNELRVSAAALPANNELNPVSIFHHVKF